MKSCERFSALLSDYAENAMAPVEKSDIAAHLNECVECRSAVEGVVNLRRSLRRLPAVQASPDFETILRTRIKLDRRASAPIWGLRYASPRRLATYSAAFALAVLCVFYLWRRLPADSLPGSPSSLNVSQMQVAPNQTLPSVSPTKILFTLDKITPQLWPNLGMARQDTGRSTVQASKDSVRTGSAARTEVTPVSHRPIIF